MRITNHRKNKKRRETFVQEKAFCFLSSAGRVKKKETKSETKNAQRGNMLPYNDGAYPGWSLLQRFATVNWKAARENDQQSGSSSLGIQRDMAQDLKQTGPRSSFVLFCFLWPRQHGKYAREHGDNKEMEIGQGEYVGQEYIGATRRKKNTPHTL